MLLLFALVLGALAKPAEEVVVIADPFARWDDTRWYVTTDVVHPVGWQLAANENLGAWVHAVQLEAVIHCRKDGRLGRRAFEVMCDVEDVALRAQPRSGQGGEGRSARLQKLMDELDERLSKASAQLQVKADGAVPSVDLEGLEARNEREREGIEVLRQLVARAMLGFHIRVPSDDQLGIEYRSALMTMPGVRGSSGSSEVLHQRLQGQGPVMVETRGRGMASLPLPSNIPTVRDGRFAQMTAKADAFAEIDRLKREAFEASVPGMRVTRQSSSTLKEATAKQEVYSTVFRGDPPEMESGGTESWDEPNLFSVDATFDLELAGIAVLGQEGYVAERLWAVFGTPTASSPGAYRSPPYVYTGRLVQLESEETLELGESYALR